MTKLQAIDAAKIEATKNQTEMFIFDAPIEVRSNNEFEIGPYTYGPAAAATTLFAWAVICGKVSPDGIYTTMTPKPVNDECYASLIGIEFESMESQQNE